MIFNLTKYLEGRKEYLKAMTQLNESGSHMERTSQARLSEISVLLQITDSLEYIYEEGDPA